MFFKFDVVEYFLDGVNEFATVGLQKYLLVFIINENTNV